MIIHDFSKENSILNQFIAELRDTKIQKDAMRFRKNIERAGQILAYELSKTLNFKEQLVNTPYGKKRMALPTENNLVLCAVLRAGLPMHQGVLNYFDNAENAFISAYRDHKDHEDEFKVVIEYLASPSIKDKSLILIDPMLATGKTLHNVLRAIKNHGEPKQIHIISVIGSKDGVDYITPIFPYGTHLWIATIDDVLSKKGYIIPGLGDAGDLSFGRKL